MPAIAALYERSFATLDFLPVLHTLAEHRAWFARALDERDAWVFESGGGAIAGFLVLGEETLDYLYLEPSARGRGIGAALLDHAKARRPGGFELWTFQRNRAARRFYERHGCVAVRCTDGTGNEEREPDVLYRWRPGDLARGGLSEWPAG